MLLVALWGEHIHAAMWQDLCKCLLHQELGLGLPALPVSAVGSPAQPDPPSRHCGSATKSSSSRRRLGTLLTVRVWSVFVWQQGRTRVVPPLGFNLLNILTLHHLLRLTLNLPCSVTSVSPRFCWFLHLLLQARWFLWGLIYGGKLKTLPRSGAIKMYSNLLL